MKNKLTRALFRVKQPYLQSDYDYDAFMSCSLDDSHRYVVKIYCFDDAHSAVVYYSDGEIEMISTNEFTCSYKNDSAKPCRRT